MLAELKKKADNTHKLFNKKMFIISQVMNSTCLYVCENKLVLDQSTDSGRVVSIRQKAV